MEGCDKGGTSFNNSKPRRQREFRKKDQTCIEGRGTPTDLSKTCEEVETGASNSNEELQPIDDGRQHNGSREPSIAKSKNCTNSNKNGPEEKTKEDSIATISLGCWLYALGVDIHLGFCKNGI